MGVISSSIKLAASFCILTVRATDVNYADRLGNEAILALVHEARACFLKQLNSYTLICGNQKISLIISDLVVIFFTEAFAHDQLTIDCQIDEIQEKSFRLFHRIRCEGKVIALIETGVVAFDFQSGHTVGLPNDFITGLQIFRSR